MDGLLTAGQLKASQAVRVPSWCSPPKNLTLKSDEVDVWRADLGAKASHVQSLQRTLSVDERIRAERYYFQKDREHFIVARGLLRTILGRYLDTDPDQLQFCYNSHGKPALTRESGGDALRFNMSHSQGLALYAITHGRELGVDLERLLPDLAYEQIAERFFSPREVTMLRGLPTNVRQEAFFICWTFKEAYLKARGKGLTLRLDQLDISLAPPEAIVSMPYGAPGEASRWSVQKLDAGPSYVAALAVEGYDWRLRCWQWSDGWPIRQTSSPSLTTNRRGELWRRQSPDRG